MTRSMCAISGFNRLPMPTYSIEPRVEDARSSRPSVVLFRRTKDLRPDRLASLLLTNLPSIEQLLAQGCIAVVEDNRIRVRALPFSDPQTDR